MTQAFAIEPPLWDDAAHGGPLSPLLVSDERAIALRQDSRDWPSWELTPRQLCDLELMLVGGFSPLEGFMTSDDYDGVVGGMRLASGVVWPIPVVLDVPYEVVAHLG